MRLGMPCVPLNRRMVTVVARVSDDNKSNSKGKKSNPRRRGRPAHLRSPDDTPLRDGNRDRLMGFLTERAARTLLCYLMETNLNLYHWLTEYIRSVPIPRNGNWDDVSGDTFLRTLLSMPIQGAKYELKREPLYDIATGSGVDPRQLAQRIMEIRTQLAEEFTQDLSQVREENATLYRETLTASLKSMFSFSEPASGLDDKPVEGGGATGA